MRVLVVGAGYVGGALLAELTRAGLDAWGVRRNPPRSHDRLLRADAADPADLLRIEGDFEQIVLCISPDERSDEAYRRAYPDACRAVAERFPKARLLLVGSTAVYAQSQGEVISDESEAVSDAFNAVRIREAEDIVLRRANGSAVVRASGIYGPGRVRTLSQLAHGELDPEVAGVWTNRIHRDDLVGVLRFLLARPSRDGVFLASDPTPATFSQMQDWVRKQPNTKHLPPASSAPRGRKSRRMHPERLLRAGYRFAYESFREGYLETLNELSDAAPNRQMPM